MTLRELLRRLSALMSSSHDHPSSQSTESTVPSGPVRGLCRHLEYSDGEPYFASGVPPFPHEYTGRDDGPREKSVTGHALPKAAAS